MPVLTVDAFSLRIPRLLEVLQALVEIESPTGDKAGVDQVGELAAALMAERGAEVERHRQEVAGDHWVGRWGDGPGGMLLMCHLDTVHPLGTLAGFPWRTEGRRLYGPGVMDMKGGLALALTAIEALAEVEALPERRISLLCTSDEETGSRTSRPLIESLASQHDLVLCLEPGMADGSVKTWRKGIGDFRLRVTGRPAHAGVEPEKGINAVVEMARQIRAIDAWQPPGTGATVTPTLISGGTAANVVPETCELAIDVRVMTAEQQTWIDTALRSLEPVSAGAHLAIEGAGIAHPWRERS